MRSKPLRQRDRYGDVASLATIPSGFPSAKISAGLSDASPLRKRVPEAGRRKDRMVQRDAYCC